MTSPQSLTESERRLVAAWAADCAEHVLPVFEAAAPDDGRPRALVERTRAFARGELGTAEGIRLRFAGGVGAAEVADRAATAAARSAGQAAAVCHMGAHALGAAAYAVVAARLAHPDAADDAGRQELDWQVARATPEVRAALRALPPLGSDGAGPLGRGLLAQGEVGAAVRELQARLVADA